MKKLSVLILLMLLVLCLCACGAEEEVSYQVQTRYMRVETGDVNLTEYSYDEAGNPLSVYTTLNGNFASAVDYSYSEDFRHVTIDYSSAIYEPYSTELNREFDAEGRVVKASSYNNGELDAVSEYFYDSEGREIKLISQVQGYTNVQERSYDKDGNLLWYNVDTGFSQSRQEYSYDKQGRMLSVDYYQNSEPAGRWECSYEGNVRSTLIYDSQGKLAGTLRSVLDEAGNVLEEERFAPDGSSLSYSAFVYIGSDGSISGKIPEEAK